MDAETYNREKAVYLYISGIETGNGEQVGAVRHQAETDPLLSRMIDEADEEMARELDIPEVTEEDVAKAKAIVTQAIERWKEQNNG